MNGPANIVNDPEESPSPWAIGAGTGLAGLLGGSVYGILRSQRPILFTAVYGIQCFAAGTLFWGTREHVLQLSTTEGSETQQKILASATGGATTGAILSLVLGRRKYVASSTIATGLIAACGQGIFSYVGPSRPSVAPKQKGNFLERLADLKWSPLKSLSDEEYAEIVRERILKLDVEISITKDAITASRKGSGINEKTSDDKPPP